MTIIKIRTAQIDDARSVLDIQGNVVSEGNFLITVDSEFSKTSEQQREWINNILKNDRETMIVAETDGKIVGWLVFQSVKRKRLSHVGSIGIMIHKDYRGIGIGKMLIKELLDWAVKNPLIEKVSLGVLSTNHRAIALYKSMGFIEEGRKIKEIKINEETYVDDVLMYKFD